MNPMKCMLIALVSTIALSGCPNVFDPLDNPSGEAQLLSAARAAFDRGDYSEARELYGKIPGNETARAEEAFVTLDEEGLGTSALVIAIAGAQDGSVGEILTRLAESAASAGTAPGTTKRTALTNAYRSIAQITNTDLRGFVQFVIGMAIAAELLAEQTGVAADKIFNKSDFAATGTTCAASGGGCAASAACDAAGGGLGAGSAGTNDDLDNSSNWATATLGTGSPNLSMLYTALRAALDGLSAIGLQEGSSYDLLNDILGVAAPTGVAAVDRCFRAGLLATGAGR